MTGLSEAQQEELRAVGQMYAALYDLYCTEGSALAPTAEALAAFSEKHGGMVLDRILIAAGEDREAARRRAAEVFSALNSAAEPAAAFAALAAELAASAAAVESAEEAAADSAVELIGTPESIVTQSIAVTGTGQSAEIRTGSETVELPLGITMNRTAFIAIAALSLLILLGILIIIITLIAKRNED